MAFGGRQTAPAQGESAILGLRRRAARALAWTKEQPVLLVVGGAAAIRGVTAAAYRPALFFPDSWAYIRSAYADWPVGFLPDRPSGYPLALRVLLLGGDNLGILTAAQHLAGLATGVLAYVLMVRLGVRRWVAVSASAVVLLDAYAIAVEQYVMAEAFFALALMVSVFIAAVARPTWVAVAASGGALAVAVTLRTSAVFALPFLAAFWLHSGGWPRATVAVLGFLAPIACYFGLQAANGYPVGFTQAGGWFLYGRVAQLTDCRDPAVRRQGEALCRLTFRN